MAQKSDDNTLAVITHLLGWFTGFIGPLIVLLATSNAKVKTHAKNALNWQISMIIYSVVSGILIIIFVGFLLLFALGIINMIFSIIAAVKAGHGEAWKYPLAIRFFKT